MSRVAWPKHFWASSANDSKTVKLWTSNLARMFTGMIYGRFAPSSVRPWTFRPWCLGFNWISRIITIICWRRGERPVTIGTIRVDSMRAIVAIAQWPKRYGGNAPMSPHTNYTRPKFTVKSTVIIINISLCKWQSVHWFQPEMHQKWLVARLCPDLLGEHTALLRYEK